jgi:hypothetical protein
MTFHVKNRNIKTKVRNNSQQHRMAKSEIMQQTIQQQSDFRLKFLLKIHSHSSFIRHWSSFHEFTNGGDVVDDHQVGWLCP